MAKDFLSDDEALVLNSDQRQEESESFRLVSLKWLCCCELVV
jgi:hypothetical protein